MRLAVGTADNSTVCEHLARSAAFVVLEIVDGKIASRSVRERETGACGNHKSFVEMLAGCEAVLCGGIGEGAARSLSANGIRPVVAAEKHSIDEAVTLFLEGKLTTTSDFICLCHEKQ
ncbi:MAG TPA: NifB/NifX family molybdenum-iron cluster-binding protein [Bryobacteraceae bacterium]